MKFGIRKPSIKKSIKARTTGKLKRKIKSTINPFYGKKGMGMIRDPKKAVYNKIYNKTTVGVNPLSKNSGCLGLVVLTLALPTVVVAFVMNIMNII